MATVGFKGLKKGFGPMLSLNTSNILHQQAGSIFTKLHFTSQLLQPDYSKHHWTIWQCSADQLHFRTVLYMHNHVMHHILSPNKRPQYKLRLK